MLVLVIVLVIGSSGFYPRLRARLRARARFFSGGSGIFVFDHEKLDVYNVALEFNRLVSALSGDLSATHRHIRDQLLRAALSIPLNIAEGNGKRSLPDRRRFFEIARGSTMECAAALDVLVVTPGCSREEVKPLKELLARCAAMLTRMTELRDSRVAEDSALYTTDPSCE